MNCRLALSSSLWLALPGSALAVAQGTLTKLADVHPVSSPNTFVGTDDLEFLYLGEGGRIAVIDLSLVGAPSGSQLMPGHVNSIQVGSLGAVPAEMLLDPAHAVDADDDGNPLNDADDVLYVACGRLGLWAVDPDPAGGGLNHAVRIDDRGNPNNPVSMQKSRRFCNQLELVKIGPETFLAATFAKKDDSVLRFYRTNEIKNLLATTAPETGSELDPV
ncbi:MAG: hypothetical protein AAF726_17015 [Planctomycetota bacterium]